MGTTADKLNHLIATKKAIRDAIVAKGVTVAETAPFYSYAKKITEIEDSIEEKDTPAVLFIDYDGTHLYSYSADEFLALSEMPELPSQEGLICEGWNWTLEDAKDQVEQGYWCTIGALYITDDDKTRVYVTIDSDYDMEAYVILDENNVYVDWGDGNITSVDVKTSVGYATCVHTYDAKGDYVITIYPQDANKVYTLGIGQYGNTPFKGNIYRKVELGKNVRTSSEMFDGCPKLETITFPKNTYLPSTRSVSSCYSLKALVLPKGGVSVTYCFGLKELSLAKTTTVVSINNTSIERLAYPSSVTTVSLSNNTLLSKVQLMHPLSQFSVSYCPKVTFPAMIQASTIGNCSSSFIKNISASTLVGGSSLFKDCVGLKKVLIDTTSSIYSDCFKGCVSLEEVYLGDGATTIGRYTFSECVSLKSVRLPNTLTSLASYAFYSCRSLEDITIPDGVTSITDNSFSGCSRLKSIVLGPSVTSIGTRAFQNCPLLSHIVFPPTVTSIGMEAFSFSDTEQYIVRILDFSKNQKIPSIGSSPFYRNNKLIIIVPNGLSEDWKDSWGMSVVPFYSNIACKDIEVTPEYISGNIDTVKISYVARCDATNFYGDFEEDVIIEGTANVYIGKNETSESVVKEASFTYGGFTKTFEVEQSAYVDNCIVCKYNATSTTSATTLMYSSFSNYSTYFSSMIVDGVETTIARTHTFSTLGEHTVIFKVADGVSITAPCYMFRDCIALTYVDCTELDLSAATSTSSSAGTALMFYNCNKLKTIILPDTIKYLGSYMFHNCVKVTSLTIKASTAPTVYGSNTWGSSSESLGYTNRATGTNKFYVPIGATGYDASIYSILYTTSYCGFTKEEVEF